MTNPQQPPNWSDPTAPSAEGGGYPAAPYDPSSYPGAVSPAGYPPPPEGYTPPTAAYPGYAYPGYGYPGYGYPVTQPTNGMAIASMVVSIVGAMGLCGYGLGGYVGIVGAILGHVARRQIRERGESGDGMALAGMIVGWISAGIAVLATVGIIALIVVSANS